MNRKIKQYEENQRKFADTLWKMKNDFIEENRVVSVGDVVIGEGYEEGISFKITSIIFSMTTGGAFSSPLPIINYYGKPLGKKGKVMESRKPVFLRYFTKSNGDKYDRGCLFEQESAYRIMFG